MYMLNYTPLDITFAINLLTTYSSSPTQIYFNGMKHILCYLRGTIYIDLFYSKKFKSNLIGYIDAGYL